MKAISLQKLGFDQIRASLLEEAKTEPGRERLRFLRPQTDLAAVQHEIAKVLETRRLLAERGRFPLPELEAIGPLLRGAAQGQFLRPKEIHLIRQYLLTSKALKNHVKGLPLPRLKGLLSGLGEFSELIGHIDQVVEKDGSRVRDKASERLYSIRRRIAAMEKSLKERLKKILQEASRAGWLQEELITKRRGRYVLPLRAEAKHRLPGILHDTSASGATVYIEPAEIIPLANEIESLRLEEERETRRLLEVLTRKILEFKDDLLNLEEIIAEIDSLETRAVFGERISGALPEVVSEGEIRLLNAAHPLLLLPGRRVVRNDFRFPSERPIVIISGPNLGGKTVALKTVGLLCLMTQAAIPIPASPDSVLPVFEEILVDIGDEQDLSQEESTFSAHVRRLREILDSAAPRKLFLIDEIGRGTDPAEGAALGMAVLERLIGTGARVLATTHYEALKAFSFSRPEILPISVTFDEVTGEPTYRLAYGVSGLSRGLSLARRLGLPEEIISRAQEFIGGSDETFKQVLESLRVSLENLEAERKALAKEREALEAERKRLLEEDARLKAALEKEEERLRAEYQRRLKELEEEFRGLTEKLSVHELGLRRAKEEFSKLVRHKTKEILPEAPSAGPVRPGARVKLRGLGQEGRVLRVREEVAEVQLGPFKVEVAVDDLVVLPEEGRPKKTSFSVRAEKEVPTSINLIGLTVDEALEVLDKYIDRAFLSGQSRLTVIHGLGTGRLMRAIREHLARHTQVARIRAGEVFEGGDAVTVVELATQEEQA